MNIYLDIDGVLITKVGQPAKHAGALLDYAISRHAAYWLTTHCRGGENNAVAYLRDKLPPDVLKLTEKIKSTDWRTLKTEAIDFSSDFLWLDDYIMEAEKNVLEKNNALNNFILVDLEKRPEQLKNIFKRLNKYEA